MQRRPTSPTTDRRQRFAVRIPRGPGARWGAFGSREESARPNVAGGLLWATCGPTLRPFPCSFLAPQKRPPCLHLDRAVAAPKPGSTRHRGPRRAHPHCGGDDGGPRPHAAEMRGRVASMERDRHKATAPPPIESQRDIPWALDPEDSFRDLAQRQNFVSSSLASSTPLNQRALHECGGETTSGRPDGFTTPQHGTGRPVEFEEAKKGVPIS